MTILYPKSDDGYFGTDDYDDDPILDEDFDDADEDDEFEWLGDEDEDTGFSDNWSDGDI